MLDDQEIIAEFVVESREHLADVENQFLAMEAAGAEVDFTLVNQVFRAVHSIKGAAGFLGFNTLGKLAHELESVLNLIRNEQLVPNGQVVDVLLQAADTLQGMIEDTEHSNERDITVHVAAIGAIVSGTSQQPCDNEQSGTEAKPAPAEPASTDCPEGPSAGASTPATPGSDGVANEDSRQDNIASTRPEKPSRPASSPSTAKSGTATTDSNIRVPVVVLDRLMNLAGELVLSRNQLLQAVNDNSSGNLDSVAARVDQVTSELQETIMQARMQVIGTVFNRFPRVVRDLSHSLKKRCELRVEGADVELDKSIIEAIGDPLTHLIRNAVDHGIESPDERRDAGKPAHGTIVLRAYHQDGKVNISIADNGRGIDAARLREKAVARGLLTPDQARVMSDNEALRLIFRPAFSTAEQVTDVSGRGVGMDVVKSNIERLGGTVAIETQLGKGTCINVRLPLTLAIIPSLIVYSAGEAYALPQASISELVRVKPTDIAARIQRLKDALVFRLRGNLIPLLSLDAALGLNPGPRQIHTDTLAENESAATANLADSVAAANALRAADTPTTAQAINIVIVESGQLRYGFVVDGLKDSEEIVVKPLGRHIQDCPCLAGATILGDGTVAMILDAADIASHCRLALLNEEDLANLDEPDLHNAEENQTVLLFSNDPGQQFGIPMELVDRVERVRSERLQAVGNQIVLPNGQHLLPLLSLEDHITALPRPENGRLFVAVFRVMQREVGLILPELIDIREVATEIDATTFREPGVLGSLMVDGTPTRLLDLFELTHAARPEWFAQRQDVALNEGQKPWVLLAEDSDFFRKQLREYLTTEGFEVVACKDGRDAWETLQNAQEKFALVVTDLEMPRMNGFELARKIKESPAVSHMPIVAVTSLSSDDDKRRAKDAGIDHYQIKLDREQLTETVRQLFEATQQLNNANRPDVTASRQETTSIER